MADAIFDPERETLEDLGRAGLRLIQPRRAFRYGTDSVLLADFAAACPGRRAVDLGAGSGVIGLLLAARRGEVAVDCVEIREDAAELCARNIDLNDMGERMRSLRADLRDAARVLGFERYDFAVSNPPYYDARVSLKSPSAENNLARHDLACTPEELCMAAFRLVRNGGRFCLCYPAARADALVCAMRGARLAPKRARIVQDAPGKSPKLLLIEGVKNGGEGMIWMPPLVLHDDDGGESAEYRRIYGMAGEGE